MTRKIYLIRDDDTLQDLSEEAYASEDLLQTLLEKYPDLLAGDQINEASPRRWLLVSREVPVPGEEDGAGRWSLDHLFLDQDAVPTLVEVKRSSDTRIRREVVGQMLDYAANAVVYWPVESIWARFEAACESRSDDPDQLIAELIEADPDDEAGIQAFRRQVKTNLQAGRVRLVFVADEIPPELRRIVEFLNEQMDPAEVLAVEIKQYVGEGIRTLVPRVMGHTAGSDKKGSGAPSEKRQWDESSFFQELEAKHSAEEAGVARKILEWAQSKDLSIWWGTGRITGSFYPMLDLSEESHNPLYVSTNGRVNINFGILSDSPPFDSESQRGELLHRLNALPGVSLPEDSISRYPGMDLSALQEDSTIERFLETFDWVIDQISATSASE